MRIHLEGQGAMKLADWSLTRGYVEIADCENPMVMHREYDGTVIIRGRIVEDADKADG